MERDSKAHRIRCTIPLHPSPTQRIDPGDIPLCLRKDGIGPLGRPAPVLRVQVLARYDPQLSILLAGYRQSSREALLGPAPRAMQSQTAKRSNTSLQSSLVRHRPYTRPTPIDHPPVAEDPCCRLDRAAQHRILPTILRGCISTILNQAYHLSPVLGPRSSSHSYWRWCSVRSARPQRSNHTVGLAAPQWSGDFVTFKPQW